MISPPAQSILHYTQELACSLANPLVQSVNITLQTSSLANPLVQSVNITLQTGPLANPLYLNITLHTSALHAP